MNIRDNLMQLRPLVRAVQFAVTGEFKPRRWAMLAAAVQKEAPDFLVDLGCGAAPILEFIDPKRYLGIDGDAGEIERARGRFSRPGFEFICGDLVDQPYRNWRGADVVVLSSVTHHLANNEVRALFRRIIDEIGPKVVFLQDACPTGLLGPLVAYLDAGDHMRTEDELIDLLNDRFEMELLWTYENPMRSFHQYLLRLKAKL